MSRVGLLGAVVLFMVWFPWVALAVLLGVAFGWQLPVAFALGLGFILVAESMPERRVGKLRAAMEYAGLALLGGIVGGLLLGGLGAIGGFVLGFMGRLPEVTGGPSFRFLRRKRDSRGGPHDSAREERKPG
jgi:MFS family permease